MDITQHSSHELTSEQQKQLALFVNMFAKPKRTDILRTPAEYGMKYEDVTFPSMDGTKLKGWFIPAGSDRLIIVNHFLGGSRYGYPGHKLPNDVVGFEVNYLPQHKALHDAGYNVLAYDLRNHGESESADGGCGGSGIYEYQDVVGSIRYAKARKDTANMKTGLYSICYGCNSTLVATRKHPEEFTHIKALLALQPVSLGTMIERVSDNAGANKKAGFEYADHLMSAITGFRLKDLSHVEDAKSVNVPTLMMQVHDDSITYPKDVQAMYDNVPVADKKLFWIQGTTNRFHAYIYFNDKPELLLEWFNTHMDF